MASTEDKTPDNPAADEKQDEKQEEKKEKIESANCVARECGDVSSEPPIEIQVDDTGQIADSLNEVVPETVESGIKETVSFKVIFSKQKFDVTFELDETVASLKSHIEKLTGVPASMQKVMFKGRMKDDVSLREHKVTKGSKIMMIGSTVNDLTTVVTPDPKVLKEEEKRAAAASKESFCKQKVHKAVLEKYGKPEDAIPGVKNMREPLPSIPLSGMYNKSGGKVRLTFKLEQDQLWIGTKERTEKVPMGSIKAVVSEAIEGHEEYHLLGVQLGPTEASRYWIYWVPTQYVEAIKDAVLGKWQFF